MRLRSSNLGSVRCLPLAAFDDMNAGAYSSRFLFRPSAEAFLSQKVPFSLTWFGECVSSQTTGMVQRGIKSRCLLGVFCQPSL